MANELLQQINKKNIIIIYNYTTSIVKLTQQQLTSILVKRSTLKHLKR